MSNITKAGLGVWILNKNNEILFFKRKSEHGSGFWCPPGGHIEFGESFSDCAKREAKEEAGIEIKNISVIGVTNDFHIKENKHFITVEMRADLAGGEPRIMEPDKMENLGWFPINKLPQPLFLPIENLLKTDFLCFCGSGIQFKQCHGKNIKYTF